MRPAPIAAVIDINTQRLTDDYRRGVAISLPEDVEPSEDWWRELASALVDYFIVQEYAAERPPELIRETLQSIGKKIDPLGKELRTIRRLPLSMELGDAAAQLLQALAGAKLLAERETERYDRIVAKNRGHDPHQLLLYNAVIDLWCHLNKPVRFSNPDRVKTPQKTLPHGPLIKFFAAVLGPVLGEATPSPHGIAEIIKRHRKALRDGFSKTKKII